MNRQETKTTVTISRADKRFLAAALFLQTSILCLAISISGTWHNSRLKKSVGHQLKIKTTLNRLESDIELHKQKERYKAQGISTEEIN